MKHFITLLTMLVSLSLTGQVSYYCPDPVLPGPAKYVDSLLEWHEFTEWGYKKFGAYLHPDSLDATPVVFNDKLYVFQYSDNNHTLYVREMYTYGTTLWVSAPQTFYFVCSGGTLTAVETVQEYFKIGQLPFSKFCTELEIGETPIARQHYRICTSFVKFINEFK